MSRNLPPKRAWQRMLSGRRLDLLDPSPIDIEISDIARGIACVARWNGQTKGDHAFSVAEHSLIVADICVDMLPTNRLIISTSQIRLFNELFLLYRRFGAQPEPYMNGNL